MLASVLIFFAQKQNKKQMIITTKDINGEDIKVLVDDSIGRFIKMYAIVEERDGKQRTYRINREVFTFEDEEGIKNSFPKHYSFLEDRFVWDEKYDAFKSKKKQLGCSAGDDRNLYMIVGIGGTLIWWRNSRGQEETIFDGKELKTEEEFNQVFELLEINKTLKWI